MKKLVTFIIVLVAFTIYSYSQGQSTRNSEEENKAAPLKKEETKKVAPTKNDEVKKDVPIKKDVAKNEAPTKKEEAKDANRDESKIDIAAKVLPSSQEILPKHRESTISYNKVIVEKSSHFGLYILVSISLLIAITALFLIFKIKNTLLIEIKQLKQKLNSNAGNNEIWNLTQRIVNLEKEISSFDVSIDEIRQEFTQKLKSLMVQIPIIPPIPNPELTDKSSSSVKYTKYADMGDGFSVGELSKEQNDENIFEIVITSNNTAKFRIVSNRNAQLFALSNAAYFLGKTCKYDTVPSSNAKITTETEGELKLHGNKWQIINPAKIIFS